MLDSEICREAWQRSGLACDMNIYQTWCYLIGGKEQAEKLKARVLKLQAPPYNMWFGREPLQCPLTVIYNVEVSKLCYALPELRPALDAWDMQYLNKRDLLAIATYVAEGYYHGDALDPLTLRPRLTFLRQSLEPRRQAAFLCCSEIM